MPKLPKASKGVKSVGICGLGHFLPPTVVTNQDIKNRGLDTSDEWIQSRTGIRERRVSGPDLATSDLAYHAAVMALDDAGISASDLDMILVATTSPDYPQFPSVACLLQARLGAPSIAAFDLSAACSGFGYALTTAAQYLYSGMYGRILVVAADTLTKSVNWEDRSTCILFGDGAGAVVLGEVEPGFGLTYASMYSDGGAADILKISSGGSKTPLTPALLEDNAHCIFMDGRAVFKVAVTHAVTAVETALKALGLSALEIDYFVPHQANLRIIELMQEKLGFSDQQVLSNVAVYGNTSAASIPILLSESYYKNVFKEGDIIMTIGFGAGFTWVVNVLRWGGIQ